MVYEVHQRAPFAVRGPLDLAIALVGFTLFAAWRAPALLVVIWCVTASVGAAMLL